MNLFRSEEHACTWSGFEPEMADRMLKPLAGWADIFSNDFFRQRGRPDYLSWTRSKDGQAAFAKLRADLS
jgi:hypothetical protein